MIKKDLLLFIFLFGMISFCACRKTVNPSQNGTVDVYVSGLENNGNVYVAKYWKNGVAVDLTDGTSNARADAITISGNDIYLAGGSDYWKNGTRVGLPDSISESSGIRGIAVSGSDVYLVGEKFDGYFAPANGGFSAPIYSPEYWKNNISVNLNDGTKDGNGNAILISGNDVYVAGEEQIGTNLIAKYWKNGVPVILTDGTATAFAMSIDVVGNDVYVGGYEWSAQNNTVAVAKYWKNGVPVILTDGTYNGFGLSIAISGNDVYVAGYEDNATMDLAKYWKNGNPVLLPTTPGTSSLATSIAVSGDDVYVSGYETNTTTMVGRAKYWKNGVAVNLTDGSRDAEATGICVSPQR